MIYAKISYELILQKKFTESIIIENSLLSVYYCFCTYVNSSPSDETLNRGPVFREMSRPVHEKDPSCKFR